MRILVACEESQRVTIELRNLGHEAYSCDLIMCSGNHPEWHIQQDVIPILNGKCSFTTCDGNMHIIEDRWDMIIAFPPCTHLSVSGARYFPEKRLDGRQEEAINFFCQFFYADCDKIAIENPTNIIGGAKYIKEFFPDLAEKYKLPRKPTQAIQPYEFGHPAKKRTCLWLKGLPNLNPTEIVEPILREYVRVDGSITHFGVNMDTGFTRIKDRGYIRSKTFPGIAKAMAEQWAGDAYELRTD